MYRFAFALAFAALILLLTMPVKAEEEAQDGKLRLIVSTTQIYDFVRQVVGDRCEVECILEAGANPHSYNPTPGDARKVIASDICFQNGLHLEGSNWMATLAKDAGKPIITCTDGIETLELEYGGKKVSDPHAWFSPKHAAVYVNNVTREMIRFDPDGEQEYKLRASLYLQQLRALDSWIRKTMNSLPVQKRILVTSHDAFNYFCAEYGFENKAPVGWSTGSEVGAGMTPKRRMAVINSIKELGVKAIFVETSVNPKLIREIAREAGVSIGGSLYSDSMGKAGLPGESYIGMMRENTIKIITALK